MTDELKAGTATPVETAEPEKETDMHEAWVQFLVEHPTRGGLAERLIFEAGWNARRHRI